MNFIKPSVIPIPTGDSSTQEMIKVIEQAYRICYKSEDKIKDGSESLIYKLLHGGEHGQMIHASPLEHRRITLSAAEWVAETLLEWQDERNTSFIDIIPQKISSAEENGWLLEGNFRAFFDFVRGYETDEDDFKGNYRRLDEARLVINNELHTFFPIIFKWMEPYDDTDSAIDWDGVSYIGESTDYLTFKIVTSRDMLQEFARHRVLSPNVESTRYCNYSKRGISFCIPEGYAWAHDLHDNDAVESASQYILFPSIVRCRTWNKEKRGVAADGSPIIIIDESVDSLTSPGPDYVQVSELRDIRPVPIDTIIADLGSLAEVYAVAGKITEMLYNKAIELGAKPQEARGLLLGCLKTELLITGTFSAWAHFIKLRNDPAADPQMQYLAKQIEQWFIDNDHADIREYDYY